MRAPNNAPSAHARALDPGFDGLRRASHKGARACVLTIPLPSPQAPDLDSAIELVNSNEHGNGTAIFTHSGAAARKFQHEVRKGGMRRQPGMPLWSSLPLVAAPC